MILSNGCRHTGHSAFTLDHSKRHVLQKEWKQRSVNDFSSILPRQMEQLGSGDLGDEGRDVSSLPEQVDDVDGLEKGKCLPFLK